MGDFDFDIAADVFYSELFRIFPGVEELFESVHTQRSMFITALRTIYHTKADDPHLGTYLEMLGGKHKEFGITKVHMDGGLQAFEKAIDAAHHAIDADKREHLMDSFRRIGHTMGL